MRRIPLTTICKLNGGRRHGLVVAVVTEDIDRLERVVEEAARMPEPLVRLGFGWWECGVCGVSHATESNNLPGVKVFPHHRRCAWVALQDALVAARVECDDEEVSE